MDALCLLVLVIVGVPAEDVFLDVPSTLKAAVSGRASRAIERVIAVEEYHGIKDMLYL